MLLTIKDIARISGYGVSTVSRALNNHPDISAEAREKIQAVAKQYNFTPNTNARQLKSSGGKSVVIIVKGTFNVFFSALLEKIQAHIDRLGYGVLVHYIDTKENEVQLAKKLYNETKPLGIIFMGGSIHHFEQDFDLTLPCVLCTTSAKGTSFRNLSSVSVDDTDAGKQAVEYLLKNGHKSIGIIGGDITTYCATQQRYQGAVKAITDSGNSFGESCYEYSKFTLPSAYEAAKKLFEREKSVTAVFAMSDTMAIGVCKAITDSGRRVPDDISVIGFDGIDMAAYYNPQITTFRQPVAEIAEETVKLLRSMIDSGSPPEHILMKAEIIEGDSVKKINNI